MTMRKNYQKGNGANLRTVFILKILTNEMKTIKMNTIVKSKKERENRKKYHDILVYYRLYTTNTCTAAIGTLST